MLVRKHFIILFPITYNLDTEKMSIVTIEEWVSHYDSKLQKAVLSMFYSCKEITYLIRTTSCKAIQSLNKFGDEQLEVDIVTNNIIFKNLRACGAVSTASSEEHPVEGQV